jgi:uncharacterized membrane protein
MTFEKKNYIAFVAGFVMIILGYLLMMGGGSDDPAKFNYEIFNAQRLTISPLLILGGFIVLILGMFLRPTKQS